MAILSRRLFMLRGATVPAAAALPAMAAAAAPVENPRLLELGRQLDAAEAVFKAAAERRKEARALYDRLCPPAPPELVATPEEARFVRPDDEMDIDGNKVWPGPGVKAPRRIITAANITYLRPHMDNRTRRARALNAKLPIALRYEQAKADAAALVDYGAIKTASYFAGVDVEMLAEAIAKEQATTLDGVVVKARAMLAVSGVSPETRGVTWFSGAYGKTLAEDIIAVTASGRA